MNPLQSAHSNSQVWEKKKAQFVFITHENTFPYVSAQLHLQPANGYLYVGLIIPKLWWKELPWVALCLPRADWIESPSWLNFTIALNQTIFCWGPFQVTLPPPLCFSHLFPTFLMFIFLRCFCICFTHHAFPSLSGSIYIHLPDLLPLTVPAFTCLFVCVHVCVSACVCARTVRNSLLCLHNYIILFSIILYSFFPQAINIGNLLFFVLFLLDLISSRRCRSLSLWFKDSLFRL